MSTSMFQHDARFRTHKQLSIRYQLATLILFTYLYSGAAELKFTKLAFQNSHSTTKKNALARISHPHHGLYQKDIKYVFPSHTKSKLRSTTKRYEKKGAVVDQSKSKPLQKQLMTKAMVEDRNADVSTQNRSSLGILATSASVSLLSVALFAYLGILTGTGEGAEIYTNSLILRDASATIFTTVAAGIFVKTVTSASKTGIIDSNDSRKLIHTLSAPLFMLCWPLYSHLSAARYFAAIVPFLNGTRLFIAGSNNKNLGGKI